MVSVESWAASFPCVGCLGDGTGGNHVQQVLSLTLNSRGGLVGRQAGVHVGHRHACGQTKTPAVREGEGQSASLVDLTDHRP